MAAVPGSLHDWSVNCSMNYLEILTEWCRNKPEDAAKQLIELQGNKLAQSSEELFTVTEAANLYGKQRKQLYRDMASEKLKYMKDSSGRRLVSLGDLRSNYGDNITV